MTDFGIIRIPKEIILCGSIHAKSYFKIYEAGKSLHAIIHIENKLYKTVGFSNMEELIYELREFVKLYKKEGVDYKIITYDNVVEKYPELEVIENFINIKDNNKVGV